MNHDRAIENLLYRYAELIDNGDLEGVARLFEHGEILAPEASSGVKGYAEVLAMYRRFTRIYPETGTPRTRHLTHNAIIEVNEAGDRAEARSCFTVFQATDALPLQPIISGRYHDVFDRVNGAWHFRTRTMLSDLHGDLSQHLWSDAP